MARVATASRMVADSKELVIESRRRHQGLLYRCHAAGPGTLSRPSPPPRATVAVRRLLRRHDPAKDGIFASEGKGNRHARGCCSCIKERPR